MRSLVVEEKESLFLYEHLVCFPESGNRQRATVIEPPYVMSVKRLWLTSLVKEKWRCIERLISNEVISASFIRPAATFRDYTDYCSAVVTVFGRIIIAEHLHFRHSVLAGAHTDFVRTTWLAGVQSVDGRNGGSSALAGNEWQVCSEAFTHRFNIILIRRS